MTRVSRETSRLTSRRLMSSRLKSRRMKRRRTRRRSESIPDKLHVLVDLNEVFKWVVSLFALSTAHAP